MPRPDQPAEDGLRTSPRSDRTRAALAAHLQAARDSQIDILALAVVGLAVRGSAAQGAIARALPLATDQARKQQRLRRVLDNERIDPAIHFQPMGAAALTGRKGPRVRVLIDRVLRTNGQNALVVSAGFRRRSIPLSWLVRDHTGRVGWPTSSRCWRMRWRCCRSGCA